MPKDHWDTLSLPADILAQCRDPAKHAAGLRLAGRMLCRSGRGREALPLLDRYHALAPESAGSLLLEASALLQAQGPRAALAVLRRALALDPEDPTVHGAVTQTLSRLGPEAADPALAAAVLADSDDPAMLARAASLLACDGPAAGRVTATADAIEGWVFWRGPAVRQTVVARDLSDGEVRERVDVRGEAVGDGPWRHGRLRMAWPERGVAFAVSTACGWEIPGAPVVSDARLAALDGAAGYPSPDPRRVDVIVPLHGGTEAARTCLASLAAGTPAGEHRLVLVSDAAPDPALRTLAREAVAGGRGILLENPATIGFARSVNRALRLGPARDVVVLNSDTILPPGWLGRLRETAAQPGVGTVNPLSNNGELVSVPAAFRPNALGSPAEVAALDAFVRAQDWAPVDLPNGIGFSLYISRAGMAAAGCFDPRFGRGYFEDIDYCFRVAEAGLRNVCDPRVYVGHEGGASFGPLRTALVTRNLRAMTARWPDFHARTDAVVAADPLRDFREPVARAVIALGSRPLGLILAASASDPRGRRAALAAVQAPERAALALEDGEDGGAAFRVDSAAALATLPVGRLLLADWARLSADLRAWAVASPVPLDLVWSHRVLFDDRQLAVLQGTAEPLAGDLTAGRIRAVLVPGPAALADLSRRAPWLAGLARPAGDGSGPGEPASRPVRVPGSHPFVAVLGDMEPAALGDAVEKLLAALPARTRLAVFGHTDRDLALIGTGRAWVTGARFSHPAEPARCRAVVLAAPACALVSSAMGPLLAPDAFPGVPVLVPEGLLPCLAGARATACAAPADVARAIAA